MTDTIQVQYEAIEQLAVQIHQQAEQTGTILQRVRSQTESLADSWVGEGATAFQHEMEEDVLPGLKRLTASLEVGGAVIKRIAEIFREAEEEAANQFPDGEGEHAGSAVGAGAGHGGSSGDSPRPSLSGGGGGGSRSPVGRVSEPLRMDQGMIAQNSLVDMRRTNPAEANRIYEQIVAMDTQGGFQVGVKIGDLELKVDMGSGVHATIEGMDGEFSSGTLDNLWNTLVHDRHVTVTVPSLSSEAEDQLERLVGLAREQIDPDVFIVVRETLPS